MDISDYANLPAGAPPPGVMPNFDHPATRAIEAHIGMGICIGVTLVFVVLRLYVKLAITHMWGWDDCACILGFALIVAHDLVAFTLMGPGKWLGTHIWDIRVASFTKSFLQRTLAAINLYAASAFFVKLSLFLLYFRIFKPNKVTRWLIYGGIVVCGLFYSASIISNCALCMPRPGQPSDLATWLSRSQECSGPSQRLAVVQGVFGTLSDMYLLVIPIQSVFQLQLPTNRKLGVSAIFMIGIIAIACSLGSLAWRAKLLHTEDVTWFSVTVYNFSAAEMSAGIICSSLPILVALFRDQAAARKSRFLPSSLRSLFSRFFSRNSQQSLIEDRNRSSETLRPSTRNASAKTSKDYMQLSETGIMSAKSNSRASY